MLSALTYFRVCRHAWFVLLFLRITPLQAQEKETFMHRRIMMERISGMTSGMSIPLMPPPERKVVGDVYLNPEYWNTTFVLYDGETTATYPARLDLKTNMFDVKAERGLASLRGNLVRSVMCVQSPQYFVNGREFVNEKGVPFNGFFQILSEGELTLLKMVELVFKPADISPSHNVGSPDDRFLKNVRLYYTSGNVALKLPGKKKMLRLFEKHATAMEKYIEENLIDLSQENHIKSSFDYYNSLDIEK